MRNLKDRIPGAPTDFRYEEFVRSETAARLGIENIPNDEQWERIELLASRVLQPVRNRFGPIKITSGFRCPELNVKIGGSANSNHCLGEAADIEPVYSGVKLVDIVKYIHDNLDFRTIIAEYFPVGWVHVDFREGGNTKVLMLKDKNHNYVVISIDELMRLYSI